MSIAEQEFSGIWSSNYRYRSSSRDMECESQHFMRMRHNDALLILESIPRLSASQLVVRLTLEHGVATGEWREVTEHNGYYGGAVYHGALQLLVSDDHRKMSGCWVGFGKDKKEINTGSWEFIYVDSELTDQL